MKSEEQATVPKHAERLGAAAPPHAPTPSTPHLPPDSSPPVRQTAPPAHEAAASPAHSSTKSSQPLSESVKAKRREPVTHERRVLLMALAAGAPSVLVSLALLLAGDYTPKVFWTLLTFILCFWLGFSFAVQGRVMRPLQTVSNLLAALREGDYSLLARGAERATGRTAEELGLADCLRVSDDEASHTLAKSFPGDGGASRRWGVRRSSFRERGVAHQLLVVADLSRPLREEELKAWQRIVRVLGHELNNSLAPIKSIAGKIG